jgi:hypothetical protein
VFGRCPHRFELHAPSQRVRLVALHGFSLIIPPYRLLFPPFLFVDVTSTLKLAMRKVSVKSTFENFKTQCATEISSSCPAGSLAVDPTAAVGVAPEPATADFQPPKPREHADGKPPMRGPGRRRLHRHEASSSDEERGVSRKDLKGINHLST